LLAAGFAVIGLIASALQIQRTKRVIAFGAVPFINPLHGVFTASLSVNDDTDSSDESESCAMYLVPLTLYIKRLRREN